MTKRPALKNHLQARLLSTWQRTHKHFKKKEITGVILPVKSTEQPDIWHTCTYISNLRFQKGPGAGTTDVAHWGQGRKESGRKEIRLNV